MNLSELRKAVVAVLGAITAILPQVLATGAGILPQPVATWLTVVASTATAILVYLVPNAPKDPAAKLQASLDALGPVADIIRDRVQREVTERLAGRSMPGANDTIGATVSATLREGDDPDPLVVPPLGR